MKSLLLITLSYPFDIGQEKTFLEEEVKLYSSAFTKTTILPCKESENKEYIDKAITLDKDLIDFNINNIKYPYLIFSLLSRPSLLIKELKFILSKKFSFLKLKKVVSNYLIIMSYYSFFKKYFLKNQQNSCVIYTYWFTPLTTAACLFAKENPNIFVVTRAHGIDLFEERNNHVIPFRHLTLGKLDKLILVSEFGKKYIQETYQTNEFKLHVSPIGTRDMKIISQKSSLGNLNIISCSRIDKNKRLDLIAMGIAEFAKHNQEINITWHHFGDGPLIQEINNLCLNIFTSNIKANFLGAVNNQEIFHFYKTNPVDVFITTSASEGGRPVSITEAISCSIPIIATNVGGIPEIVNSKNGILLEINPSPEGISNAIYDFLPSNKTVDSKREQSRKIWEEKCNAEKIFPEFINLLKSL